MFYDFYGNPVETAYTYSGEKIGGGGSKKAHSQLAMMASLSDAWKSNCDTVYQSFTQKISEISNPVPFFITTDQHGRRLDGNRYFNNIDTTEAANLQLGDNCTDFFNSTEFDINRVDCKKVANMISVVGNHDVKITHSADATLDDVKNAFCYDSSRLNVTLMDSTENYCYAAIDTEHSVKYLALDLYKYATTAASGENRISTEIMNWLLKELMKDDYDIVILNHQQLKDAGNVHRDGTAISGSDDYEEIKALWELLKAYNGRQSGTYTDTESVTHDYDFSAIKHRALVALHGHWHEELILSETNMTAYSADWYGNNNSAVMGVIDRDSNQMYIFKFDSAQIYDMLTIAVCSAS